MLPRPFAFTRKKLYRSREAFLLFAILILTVLVYWPGLHGDFVLDDFPNLLHNPAIQVESLTPEELWSAAFSSGAGTLRRPVSMFTFAANYYFSHSDAFYFKLVNLVIHALCGLAILVFTRQLLTAYKTARQPALSDNILRWIPLVVAAFWLVHPLNLTGVLYVVQRMTSLSALFTILALSQFVKARIRLFQGEKTWVAPMTFSAVLGGLGLLSKENAVLAPLFALLIECAIFRGKTKLGTYDKRMVWGFGLSVGLPVLLAMSYLLLKPDFLAYGYSTRTFTMFERLLTESRVLMFYLESIIAPTASSLGLYHDDFILSTGWMSPPTTALSIAAIIVLIAAGLWLLRLAPILGLGILWFFVGHLLESTIIPLELVYEHRNYLPSYGVLLALTYGGGTFVVRFGRARIAAAVTPVILAVFAAATLVRAQQWQDNVTLSISEAANHPTSPRAVYTAGRIYANLYLTDGISDPSLALQFFERARELDKNNILPAAALIMYSVKAKLPLDSAWIETIVQRLAYAPVTASTVATLRILSSDRATVEALSTNVMDSILRVALENAAPSGQRRADILTIYGNFRANYLRDYGGARRMFLAAIEAEPSDPQYRINLTQLLVATGDVVSAKEALTRAIEADYLGRYENTIAELADAIDTFPAPSTR